MQGSYISEPWLCLLSGSEPDILRLLDGLQLPSVSKRMANECLGVPQGKRRMIVNNSILVLRLRSSFTGLQVRNSCGNIDESNATDRKTLSLEIEKTCSHCQTTDYKPFGHVCNAAEPQGGGSLYIRQFTCEKSSGGLYPVFLWQDGLSARRRRDETAFFFISEVRR